MEFSNKKHKIIIEVVPKPDYVITFNEELFGSDETQLCHIPQKKLLPSLPPCANLAVIQ